MQQVNSSKIIYTNLKEGKNLSPKEFAEYLSDLNSKYPISSIEDGMDEDDNIVQNTLQILWVTNAS